MDELNEMGLAIPSPTAEEQLTQRFFLRGYSHDELEDTRIDALGKLAFLAEFGASLQHSRHVPFMRGTLEERADLFTAELLWRSAQEAVAKAPPAWYPAALRPGLAAEIVRHLPPDAFLEKHAGFGEGMFRPVLLALRSPCPIAEHDPEQGRFFLRPDSGAWACVDCETAGDLAGLAHRLLGLAGDALLDALLQEAGLPKRGAE